MDIIVQEVRLGSGVLVERTVPIMEWVHRIRVHLDPIAPEERKYVHVLIQKIVQLDHLLINRLVGDESVSKNNSSSFINYGRNCSLYNVF
jgi:hypothetical protein